MPSETLDEMTAMLRLAIAADGVMVPFRPHPKTAKGKTRWREVKVGLFARLGQHLTRSGKQVTRLCHRRLVAVLGDIDTFIPLMQMEAQRQSVDTAPQVIWLSDGDGDSGGSTANALPIVRLAFSISIMRLGICGERRRHYSIVVLLRLTNGSRSGGLYSGMDNIMLYSNP